MASHNRVAKIMRENGWRAKAAKKYKATTNSNHSSPVAPNLLEQDFEADVSDQKWVSDITSIWTEEGLAVFSPSSLNYIRVGDGLGQWLNA
jgi:putative transposase